MQKKYILLLAFFIFQSKLFASGISGEDIANVTANFIGIPASFISVILSVGFGTTEKSELNIGKFTGMTIALSPLFLVNLFYFLCNPENNKSWFNSQNIFSLIGLISIMIGYSRLIYLYSKKTNNGA